MSPKAFVLSTIAIAYTLIHSLNNLQTHHNISPDEIEELLEKPEFTTPVFIAFYDDSDIDKKAAAFLDTFISVLEEDFPSIKFYIYAGDLKESIRSRYFLHYYTMPKLKLFCGYEHKTYDGGSVKTHIKAWVQRQTASMLSTVNE